MTQNEKESDYEMAASVRLWHPNIGCDYISTGLGMKPKLCNSVGLVRRAPDGRILNGVNSETFWLSQLDIDPNCEIDNCLSEVVETLQAKTSFFSEFFESGGRGDLSIGVFMNSNTGFELNAELVAKISKLGLALTFNLYLPE